jgi:putative ABC transport system permease protein
MEDGGLMADLPSSVPSAEKPDEEIFAAFDLDRSARRGARCCHYAGSVGGRFRSACAGRRRIGSLLVVAEVALAMVLLVGGGLMLKSFVRLVNIDPGFNPHNVLRMDLSLPGPRYAGPQQQSQFYEDLVERIKVLPGVAEVGATTQTPLGSGNNWAPFSIEGRPAPSPGQESYAAIRSISSDYFRVMNIPLRKGRYFGEFDAPQTAPVIIINETMARQFWPNEDPLGRQLSISASPSFTVVGVVGDVRHGGLNSQPNPEMFLPHPQAPQPSLAVMVRTSGDPLLLAGAVREQAAAVDKDLPVAITTMDQIFSDSVGGQRFNMLLLSIFAALALVMVVIGVFGVINCVDPSDLRVALRREPN